MRLTKNTAVDMAPESDVDVIAQRAFAVVERLRDDDPRRILSELANMCRVRPTQAAQMIMALAAWVDPAEPTATLWERVERITQERIANGAHLRLAVNR